MQPYAKGNRVRATRDLPHGLEAGRQGTVVRDSSPVHSVVDVKFDEPSPNPSLIVAKINVEPLAIAVD